MVGWYHRLNGHEFEQTPGVTEGQGSLVCCSPQGHKEMDTTEQLNNNNSILPGTKNLSFSSKFVSYEGQLPNCAVKEVTWSLVLGRVLSSG